MSVSQKGLSLLLRIIKSSDANKCQFIFLPFLLGLYVLIIIIVIIICCYFYMYTSIYLLILLEDRCATTLPHPLL